MMGQGVMSDDDEDDDRKPMLQHLLYYHDHMHPMKVNHHHVMQDDHHQDCSIPLPPTKPKISSLADIATSRTPPPGHQWPNVISPVSPYPTPRRCRRLGHLTLGKAPTGCTAVVTMAPTVIFVVVVSPANGRISRRADRHATADPTQHEVTAVRLFGQQQPQHLGGRQGTYNGYHHQQHNN
ncbi:uncharacterized protein LOC132945766 [Metopolophium dirhodum]|uniref:uncharacterized protein LOC132945766 n=1 Tax=Metopolophium dirhodum TaxID=44670 RepID=UPI0029907346|nr:uncharacterized protein LOC132945766 [Metopolophium dirhodum]